MRIAYIVPYVPNLIRTRPYNLITGLSAQGHEITVFTLGFGDQDQADVDALTEKGIKVCYQTLPAWRSLLNSLVAIPSWQPLQTVYSWHPRMAQQLFDFVYTGDKQKRFDVFHIEHLRGSRYGVFLKSRFPELPVVWDSVDSISHLFRQASSHGGSMFGKLVTRLELPRTERAEGVLTSLFDQVLITSETDKNALVELVPSGKRVAPVSVLPNGVDLEYFHPNPGVQREPETVIFSGKMSYHANIAMVKYLISEVMPRIWKRRPSVRLTIVGKDPPPDVRSFAENPLITVTGTVEDIRPFLWKSMVAVVPLIYGAGIQNKILEAMATGIPVVATSKACVSLDVIPGNDIFVADTPDNFSAKVLQLLEDVNLQSTVGKAGLKYVQKRHNWNNIVLRLVDIYCQTIDRKTKV